MVVCRRTHWRDCPRCHVPPVPMAGLSPQPCPANTNGGMSFFISPSQTSSRCCQWRHRRSRHCQWRYKLHASNNDDTHVNNRPSLQFVLKYTLFDKLFLKQPPTINLSRACSNILE